MPITTPELSVPVYQGDKDHFQHVLDCLFVPAVEAAGLKPIPPIAKGADMIHVNIINQLEKAEMVLCDMSTLNANVFFELGVRTATAKPVCLVKDIATPKVPFDIGVVNYHPYSHSLDAWSLEDEIKKLADHIKSSVELSKGENMRWKTFSLQHRAQFATPDNPTQATLAMLVSQIQGLSEKLDSVEETSLAPNDYLIQRQRSDHLFPRLVQAAGGAIIKMSRAPDQRTATVFTTRKLTGDEQLKVAMVGREFGVDVLHVADDKTTSHIGTISVHDPYPLSKYSADLSRYQAGGTSS
jgi:hypothetical protein